MEKKARLADLQKQKEEAKKVRSEEVAKLAQENLEKSKALKEAIAAKQKQLLSKKQYENSLLRIEINVGIFFG